MNTKKLPLLASTLIAASFALSVPVLADPTYLPNSTSGTSFDLGSGSEIATGDYAIDPDAENKQGWFIPWNTSGGAGNTSLSFGSNTTFSGTGLIGIFFNRGDGSTVETVDLQNVDASNFSGQLIVLNNWNNETDVKLLGDSWANVEYLFANAVDDTTLAAKYGLEGYTRGDLGNSLGGKTLEDVLALQGNTTLAGVTGATKGATTHGTDNVDVTLCDHEFITVAEAGQTLTIAGSDTYAFYGTAGTDSARMSLEMAGSGSQTFGGTNYLADVTVTSGTLALDGTTSITGTVSVAEGGTLELGGEITLSSAITNAGTVIVDSDVVFVLSDSLKNGDNTYTIISNTDNGKITGWDSLDYSNFSGVGVTSDRQITFGSDGTITVDTTQSAQSLTWNGSSGDTWDSGNGNNTVWKNDTSSSADSFYNGDNVTFTSTGAGSITVSGDVHAGTMEVSSGTYTFSASDGSTLTVDTLNMSGGNITFSVDATIGTFNTATGSSAAGKTITLTDGTTLTVGTLTNAWGASSFVLNEGSEIDVDSASFAINSVAVTVSGSGTWKANTFEFSNYGTYTFEGGVSLEVGTITMGQQSSLTLTGAGTFTIGTYQQIDDYGTPPTTFAIGDNTTVDVETFTVSWHQNTTTLGTDAVLNVTGELSLHTADTEEFTGGTINAEKISLSNSASASFSGGTLNIGSGGITNTSSGHIEFGDDLTVGVYAGTNENKSWSTGVAIQLAGTDTGTTFFTDTDESITITGSISGAGNLTKTGAGTLTVSSYDVTGTTTVSAGTLVFTGQNTDSTTAVSIANLVLNGGTLAFSTTSGASTITLGSVTVSNSTKIAIGLNANNDYNGKVVISSLSGTGTLSLDGAARTTAAAIFELTGSTSSFTGKISLSESETSSTNRGITLIISSEKAAAGAVIEMGSEADTSDAIALGVNASRVEIAGLTSNNSGGDVIYSGSVSLGATLGNQGATLADYKNQSGYGQGSAYDDVGKSQNTLVINTADGTSYSFTGNFLDKVNIEKTGAGTQSITFQTGQWQTANYFDGSIAVKGGTLNLSGVAITSSGITVDSGATLNISNTITLAEGSTSTISGTLTLNTTLGTSTDGTVEFASGAQLILTDAFLASAIATYDANGEEQSINIIMASSITFGNTTLSSQTSEDLATLLADYVSYSDSYQLTWSYADGTLSAAVTYLPEPSMFGLMFGLGAIGLVATRRRRRRA